MAVKIDRQCRVITTRETGEDDALTVAAVREFAWSLNNYKAHVSSQKLISIFAPEDAVWSSGVDSNSERLAHCFAPRWVPNGFNRIHLNLAGYVSGAGNCTWRLYCGLQRYAGPLAFDASYLGPVYDSTSIQFSGAAHAAPAATTDLVLIRSDGINFAGWNPKDPVAAVVLQAHAGNVDTVLVGGRAVKRDGRLCADVTRASALVGEAQRHVARAQGG